MNDFTKAVKKILIDEGCYFKRQGKGDHEVWYSPISERNIYVDSNMKSRHTANSVLKSAGIDRKI